MSDQLRLDLPLEPRPDPPPLPRLLWCSDTARMGGPCPYTGDRLAGGCCKDIVAGRVP